MDRRARRPLGLRKARRPWRRRRTAARSPANEMNGGCAWIRLLEVARIVARYATGGSDGATNSGGWMGVLNVIVVTAMLAVQAAELPPPFPRPGTTKLLENDAVAIWDGSWLKKKTP